MPSTKSASGLPIYRDDFGVPGYTYGTDISVDNNPTELTIPRGQVTTVPEGCAVIVSIHASAYGNLKVALHPEACEVLITRLREALSHASHHVTAHATDLRPNTVKRMLEGKRP